MKTFKFKFGDQISSFENYLDFYLKNKSTDCILYSEDCSKFKVHKELFGQTDFLREILSSTKEQCCGTIEVLCPCSKEELKHLVNFLYDGEIHCEGESESLKIIENLQKIFGFPRNLNLDLDQDATFFNTVDNIEAMTITEEVFEDILDDPNAENVVIIPVRRKDARGELIVSDQGKEDNVLDNDKKKVSKKNKKSKKISLKKVKGSSMKRYPKIMCNECGASFTSKNALQLHINAIHLKLKPYECDLCKMSFTQRGSLNMHVRVVHQKIKPFERDHCKKTFATKANLNSHIQSNCKKLKKKYKCKECESSFANKYYLKHHVNRVHLKIKPLKKFLCDECEEPFEQKQYLDHHMNRIHLKVKPYECNFCQKAFFIKGHLKTHLKRYHEEEAK